MSLDMLLEKQVKCRKPHLCIWCGETIEVGETASFRKYVLPGEIHNDWYHPECHGAMLGSCHYGDWWYDGFDPYTFKRGTEEER